MSATTTSPSTTISHPPATSTTEINIPSTTVIGIGLGFVGFALSIFGLLLCLRLLRIWRKARSTRSTDNPVTFRDIWENEGGFFGFMNGANGAHSMGIGAGGFGMYGGGSLGMSIGPLGMDEHTRARLWNELGVYWDVERRRWARVINPGEGFVLNDGKEEEEFKEKPIMWEVQVPEKASLEGMVIAEDVQLAEMKNFVPLSVHTLPIEPLAPTPPSENPSLRVSLLISLPAPPPLRRIMSNTSSPVSLTSADWEDELDLPELIVGSTYIDPVVPSHWTRPIHTHSDGDGQEEVEEKQEEKEKQKKSGSNHLEEEKKEIEIAHLENGACHNEMQENQEEEKNVETFSGHRVEGGNGTDEWRSARWVKEKDSEWRIEGLEE